MYYIKRNLSCSLPWCHYGEGERPNRICETKKDKDDFMTLLMEMYRLDEVNQLTEYLNSLLFC